MSKRYHRAPGGHFREAHQSGGAMGYSGGPAECPHCGVCDNVDGNLRDIAIKRPIFSRTTLWECKSCGQEWETYNEERG